MGFLKGPGHLNQPGISCQSCFPRAWLTTQVDAVKVVADVISAGESHHVVGFILEEISNHEDFMWGDQHLPLLRKDRSWIRGPKQVLREKKVVLSKLRATASFRELEANRPKWIESHSLLGSKRTVRTSRTPSAQVP